MLCDDPDGWDGLPGGRVVKNLPANAGDPRDVGSIPGSGRSPGGGSGNLLPLLLPGKFHGQRSLAGYSPWGPEESKASEHMERREVSRGRGYMCVYSWVMLLCGRK